MQIEPGKSLLLLTEKGWDTSFLLLDKLFLKMPNSFSSMFSQLRTRKEERHKGRKGGERHPKGVSAHKPVASFWFIHHRFLIQIPLSFRFL